MFICTGAQKADSEMLMCGRSSVWFWLDTQSKFRMSGSKLSIRICDFPVYFLHLGIGVLSAALLYPKTSSNKALQLFILYFLGFACW